MPRKRKNDDPNHVEIDEAFLVELRVALKEPEFRARMREIEIEMDDGRPMEFVDHAIELWAIFEVMDRIREKRRIAAQMHEPAPH